MTGRQDASGYYRGRAMSARFAGYCGRCQASIGRGETVWYIPAARRTICGVCSGIRQPDHGQLARDTIKREE